jgi:hypothetical protein
MSNQEQATQAIQEVTHHISYFYNLVVTKPFAVAVSAIASAVIAKLTTGLPDHILSIGSLSLLVFIDWLTKYHACRKRGIPFTSKVMREKGIYKLRDYMMLYIAGACTIPLLNDTSGYRAVVAFMAMVELWSVAENLHDAGTLPYDVRQVPFLQMVKLYLAGKGKLELDSPVDQAIPQPNPVEPGAQPGGGQAD